MLERGQRVILAMVVGGFLLALISFILIFVVVTDGSFRSFFMNDDVRGNNAVAYFLLGMTGFGVLVFVAGLIAGLKNSFSNDSKKPMQSAENVRIIALIINNQEDLPVFDVNMYDPDELRCYVQLILPNGEKREMKASYQLLTTMGEGLVGDITYQGRWLCSFKRWMAPAATAAPDPFVR